MNGELVYGHDGFAGEIGHTLIIQHGRLCGCGRRGCLEQYCSATGIVKTYLEILKNDDPAMYNNIDFHKINAKQFMIRLWQEKKLPFMHSIIPENYLVLRWQIVSHTQARKQYFCLVG